MQLVETRAFLDFDFTSCAGFGAIGRLGIALGNTSDVTVPVPVATIASVSSGWAVVSAGGYHTCAIADSTRASFCWGACCGLWIWRRRQGVACLD